MIFHFVFNAIDKGGSTGNANRFRLMHEASSKFDITGICMDGPFIDPLYQLNKLHCREFSNHVSSYRVRASHSEVSLTHARVEITGIYISASFYISYSS